MYATLAELRNLVIDQIEERGDNDLIDRYIRQAIGLVEHKRRWDGLQESETVTPDSSGIIKVHPLCRVVNVIYPYETDLVPGYEFSPRTDLYNETQNRQIDRYFISAGIDTGGSETYTVDVTKGSSTVSINSGESSWFDADDVGNLVLFNEGSHPYAITAVVTTGGSETITIDPKYSDDTKAQATARNNPPGLQQYKLIDAATTGTDSVFTDDVVVYYQRYHPPMVMAYDPLLIPAKNSIALRAVAIGMKASKYDVDAQRLQADILEAEMIEFSQEPKTSQRNLPQGSWGGATLFGTHTRNNYGK